MTRPRVLVIGLNYLPESTGIAPYTTGMAEFLSSDFDVDVLTTFPHYPSWEFSTPRPPWRAGITEVGGARVTRLRHYIPGHPTGLTRILSEATFAARALVAGRRRRADVVVCVTPALLSVGVGWVLARRWKVKLGVVVQDLYGPAFAELGLFGGRFGRAASLVEGRLLGKADSTVFVHSKMSDAARSLYRSRLSDVRCIRNWTHVASGSSSQASVRGRLGWRDDEVVVLHAGNMGAKQGLDGVVQAARQAEKSAPHVRFVLMGDGAERERLVNESRGASQLSIMDGVPDDEFVAVLAAADILLLHERQGLRDMCAPSKLTSYLAAGKPVMAVTEEGSAAALEVLMSGSGEVVASGAFDEYFRVIERLRERDPAEVRARSLAYIDTVLSPETAAGLYRRWVHRLMPTT